MCASQRKELPLSPKGLGTQHCYSCCIGSSCGLDSNPGSGTSICGGCSWKWKVTEQMHRLNYMLTYSQRDESLKTIKSNYFSYTGPGGGSGPHKLASSSKPSQALRPKEREDYKKWSPDSYASISCVSLYIFLPTGSSPRSLFCRAQGPSPAFKVSAYEGKDF